MKNAQKKMKNECHHHGRHKDEQRSPPSSSDDDGLEVVERSEDDESCKDLFGEVGLAPHRLNQSVTMDDESIVD